MKNFLLLMLLILLSCCNKKTSNIQNDTIATTYYKKAKKLTGDSAYYYYNLAKNAYLDIQDSSGVGRSLVNMAIIQQSNGDYYGSIESSVEGNKYLKNVNDSIIRLSLGGSFNNMGISSSYLYEFDNAVKFYIQALKYANKPNDVALYHNNLGDALMSLKDSKAAEQNFILALNTTVKKDYARALNNLARARYSENPEYDPLPNFYEALRLREEAGDPVEENSSYATLSNYFLDKDKEKALEYAKKMLAVSKQKDSKEDQAQALQKIVNLDKENYLQYFKEFQVINDSLQISKSKAKNQFAFIRYDVEQKNAAYERLSKTSFQKNIGILALVLGLLLGFFWHKRRKKLLEQQKELEVKNTQLKMSKKVHDVVANGIYQVMTKIENQEDFDRNRALDELEFVYEKSRDLSYEKAWEEKEFSQEISELIAGFNNATVKTFTAGNDPSVWEKVSPEVKGEVFQMVRELMVNMKKHSQASHVAVKFEKADETVEIQYKDNGVGISGDLIYKNGLRNTASRIEAIGGTITFDTKIEKGLKVNLSFPAS
ncbi:ATP-binding protein [Chryseobacterium lineare]